jgi:membrane protease YdiL (CAAX protease family)
VRKGLGTRTHDSHSLNASETSRDMGHFNERMNSDSAPTIALNGLFTPKRVLTVIALAFASTLIAGLLHADGTLLGYVTVVLLTLGHATRSSQSAAFRIRRQDALPTAIGLIAISLALLFQYLVPLCIGSCGSFPAQSMGAGSTFDMVVLANVFAPLAETIVVQGWIYSYAAWFFNSERGAVLASVVLFALMHLALTPTIVVASVVLTVLRQRTKSLGPPALVHFVINLQATALFLASR